MTTNKGTAECCMCGDCGFSEELFQCKVCVFRSQHRYCSNLYPKAESYGTCNWCLRQKEDIKEKSPNSSNSSSSCRNNGCGDDENKNGKTRNSTGGKKGQKGSAHHLQPKNPTKKQQRSPPPPSPSVLVSTRKRIITNGALEEKLRRTGSENISDRGGAITRQVFRNRVRRYKLLDEVSS